MSMIRLLVACYIGCFIGVRFMLYQSNGQTPLAESGDLTIKELCEKSAQFDGYVYRHEVQVVSRGNFLLDLLFIENVVVQDESGESITVYGNFSVPAPGMDLVLEADFRQILSNSLIPNWCGLIWRDAKYARESQKPLSSEY